MKEISEVGKIVSERRKGRRTKLRLLKGRDWSKTLIIVIEAIISTKRMDDRLREYYSGAVSKNEDLLPISPPFPAFLVTSKGDDGILPNPDESADPVADLSRTLMFSFPVIRATS